MVVKTNLLLNLEDYLINPDKYVFPFIIKEKGKERTIITYNKGQNGSALRKYHEKALDWFNENIADRNEYSFAYHKSVRCADAIREHLKSNFFIKLDIHKFFESITENLFFGLYGDYFNKKVTKMIKACFYKGSLSIGFVTSPSISDYFMKGFDKKIAAYVEKHPETHYSRYSDDILLSSEETDDDTSLSDLFNLVKDELEALHLEINPQKTQKIKLSYQEHNSLSYLGLGISKLDDIDNKVTISKRYILFLLSLIKKNKIYGSKCRGLLDEINSRVAYLAYNSPVSYARFQKKHLNVFGEEYLFTPRKPLDRVQPILSNELPDFGEFQKTFQFEIHDKITNTEKYGFTKLDAITITKYIGNEKVVRIPKFVDSIGERAFYSSNVKEIIFEGNIKQIAKEAFFHCYYLEKIVFPESLRFIGAGAFNCCPNLKEIVIPNKVKAINQFTFSGCGLESITLPSTLKEIRSSAFEQCSRLKEIVLPEGLEALNSYAFSHCSDLEKVVLPDGLLKIDSYAFGNCSKLKEVHLPASLLEIEDGAFEGCSRLKSIVLPDYLCSIGFRVFNLCPLLDNISLGNNSVFSLNKHGDLIEAKTGRMIVFRSKVIDPELKTIPDCAFIDEQIKSIVIPEGIERIGIDAFRNCTLLKEIKLPSTLKEIGTGAFSGCISLKEIVIPEGVKIISRFMLSECSKLEKVVLPESLLVIDEEAFTNDQLLKDISIPHSVSRIGKHAFKYCYGIKNLYLSENAKKVHKKAFYGCSYSLESIKVNPANRVFTSGQNTNTLIVRKTGELVLGCQNSYIEEGVNIIYNHAFVNCVGLKKIALPKTTTIIQKGAFQGCLNLEKVDLGNVYTIQDSAFAGDEKITQINLPESLTKLGVGAFLGTNIKVLRIPTSLGNYPLSNQTFNLESVEELYISSAMQSLNSQKDGDFIFPNLNKVQVDKLNPVYESEYDGKETNTITTQQEFENQIVNVCLGSNNAVLINRKSRISGNAFRCLNHLKKIHIGGDVELSDGCFSDCKSLKEVVVDSSSPRMLPVGTFSGCTNLEKVVLNNVQIIGKDAFANCKSLKSIVLPKSLEKIGFSAFKGCSSLKEIEIPSKVTSISFFAFGGCSKLESISLPKGLQSIDSMAFKGCLKLKDINIPNTVNSIGSEAFYGCESLKEIILPNKLKILSPGVFVGCISLNKVALPKSLEVVQSRSFEGCNSLINIELGDKISIIGPYAFKGCESLKQISLPKKLEIIEQSVFENCPSLEKVLSQSKVRVVGQYAFKDCSSLKEIVLPDTLNAIGAFAFHGCSSLKNINIPRNLERIGSSAFKETAIESLTFGNILNEIGDECFISCKKLKKVDFSKAKKLAVIPNGAFRNCANLSEVLLPKELIRINQYAFAQCPKLKDIKLPETVYSIELGAFAFDTGIKEIYLPRDLTIFNNGAYTGCNIQCISVHKQNKIFHVSHGNTIVVNKVGDLKLKSILYATSKSVIDQDIENIISWAFLNANNKQEELVIPSKVKSIGSYAFENWELKRLSFLGKEPIVIGPGAFSNSPLENFALPETTYQVSDNAFRLVNLEELYIPKGLISFSKNAFNTEGLKKIVVDEDNPVYASLNSNILVQKDRKALVMSCINSTIPEGIERISDLSNNVITYNEFNIPESLDYINPYALLSAKVKKFVIAKKNPYFITNDDGSALISRNALELIHYSRDGILPEGIRSIRIPFELNKDAKKLYIPSTLKDISNIVLLDTSNIEEIEVSEDNPYFDSRNGCNAIIDSKTNKLLLASKNTVIPEDVTVIESCAFTNRGIQNIFIPKQITFISSRAFEKIGRIVSIKVDKDNPIFAVSDDGHDLIINENYAKSAGKRAKHFVLVSDPVEEPQKPELKYVDGFEYDGLTPEERAAIKAQLEAKLRGKMQAIANRDNPRASLSNIEGDDLPF